MKKTILSLLFLCFCNALFAQFQVGDAQVPTGGRAGSLDDDDLAMFKKSTTIFVVQAGDKGRMEDFNKSIADVWKITPYRVITPDSLRFFQGRNYSWFTFGGFTVEHRSPSMSYSNTHISYDLTIPEYNKRGEQKGRTILAGFILSPDMESVMDLSAPRSTFEGRKARERREEQEASTLNRTAAYSNWGPGQIRGYLKAINDNLSAHERHGMFEELSDDQRLRALKNDTLYLPSYLNVKLNPFTGSERAKNDGDADEDVNKVYPYPHRYVSKEELENMLVHATKPIYHLIYVRSSTNKFVSVVEAKSARIIYSEFHNVSYNFKNKDLKKLAKAIE